MSMIAKDGGGMSIPALEDGVYIAVCNGIIDIGIQNNEQFANKSRKMMIQWQLPGHTLEIDGQELPRRIQKQYGFSLNSKSNLRKDLEAWRGQAFTDEELKGFDLTNILNIPCQLQIINKERAGKSSYNDIAGIMALPKGNKVDKLEDKYLLMLDLEDQNTFEYYSKIPKWIQERISKAENFEKSGLKKYIEEQKIENIDEIDEDAEYITINENYALPF